ncbi:MAG: gamma-carotene 1'-hydroxylase CruF [Geitlerinemataceae cyanobacterium]
MKRLELTERVCLGIHVFSMAFGLAGLLLVLPNPEFIASLPPFGMELFGWSMAQGGVGYIVLGAIAVALNAYRFLGLRPLLAFVLPTLALSLSSELLGTSTGFPFGAYHYLSGLGYKIAGLVPFTIPLSWFYMGFVCYVLARAALESLSSMPRWVRQVGAIALGAILLTAWDLVLDPAMTQTPYPFWAFDEVGEFFGMPSRNITGWIGTGVVFMTVASLFQRGDEYVYKREQLGLPLIVYVVNFLFGATITLVALDSRFTIPASLSVLFGVIPALLFWRLAPSAASSESDAAIDEAAPVLETVAK